MVAPSQDLIDQLLAAAQDARAAAVEARQARKDLRQATVEAKKQIDSYIDSKMEAVVDKWWKDQMSKINITELGAGLKRTFDQWIELLADATDVLKSLNEKDEEMVRRMRL